MATEFRKAPVCIFSFNRPDYLRETLLSITASMTASGMVGPVVLFQDGSFSSFTKVQKCAPELVEACKDVFLSIIPHGVIFHAHTNLGIASNIYRAEKWAFEEMCYDVAIFFEDDMILAPRYFEALVRLNHLAEQNQRIGMFSAYGSDGTRSPEDQHRQRKSVGEMHHNWAFGLRRTAWIAREAHTRAYMDIIKDDDYRLRSAYRIASWYIQMGWPPLATNQDIAKCVSLNHAGIVRISTTVILAKYIGRLGEHYTNEEYERLGFGNALIYSDYFPDDEIEIDPLTEADVEGLWSSQREKLLATRLSANQLVSNADFVISKQIIAAIRANVTAKTSINNYIEFATGIFGDLWCGPRSSLIIKPELNLKTIEISGQIASHLPAETAISFFLNGQQITTVANKVLKFSVTIDLSPNLRRLKKILTTSCSVVSDPFSSRSRFGSPGTFVPHRFY